MVFLEAVIVNIVIFVLCMYIDRYLLDNFCKKQPFLDAFFKVWLVATFLSVAYLLFKMSSNGGIYVPL
jgi:hypothetical protein